MWRRDYGREGGGERERREGREKRGKGGQGRAGIGTNGTRKHRFKGPQTMWPAEEHVQGGARLRREGRKAVRGLL